MNKFLSGLVVILVVVIPNLALSEPITLSMIQAQEVLNGMAILGNGHEVIIKEGERERAVKVPYKSFSVGLILALTKNLNTLKPAVFAYQEAKDKRQRDLAGDDGKLSFASQRILTTEIEKQSAETQVYDLVKIKSAELKLEINPISPNVLSAITPILIVE